MHTASIAGHRLYVRENGREFQRHPPGFRYFFVHRKNPKNVTNISDISVCISTGIADLRIFKNCKYTAKPTRPPEVRRYREEDEMWG